MEMQQKRLDAGRHRRRLLLFPVPLQGHLNPMFQLATILHSKGFSITILHTHFNSPNPSNYPDFNFEPISDGFSDSDHEAFTTDVVVLMSTLNRNCIEPFRECLSRLLLTSSQSSDDEPIACLVSDAIWHFSQAVADDLKLPRIVLRTSSVTSFPAFAAFSLLRQKGYLIPIKDTCQVEELVPELPPLRIKDLPDVETKDPESKYELIVGMIEATKSSSGLIWNSFEALDQQALDTIRQDCPIPCFPIGPFHKHFSSSSSCSLLTQDESCIAWLDSQAPRSVIYVSFGSLAAMDETDFVETAWGLANSKQPFLWVIRPGSIRGLDWIEGLPNGFLEMTQETGRVIKWAPQQEVLAHKAVGGFWTHNGWNSTLESVCEGVPMLCSPWAGDQKVNARYVSQVYKVGLQLENGFEREEIERSIRRLMVDGEGKGLGERALKIKEKAELCLIEGGSSYETLESLISCILSF